MPTMPKLPENVPFETAFIAVFGGEIERRGGDLAEAAQCFYPGADLDDYDPDQIRDDLSEAITEAAATLGFTFPAPAGPALDQLYEMALDSFGPLRDYIEATTDHGEEGPMSDEYYVQKAGLCCPVCRSSNIGAHAIHQAEARTAWQEVRCNACGSTWNDIYNLTGFDDLEVGNG